ncbi:MAG: DUF2061 domain-containing protein [Gammaproteobacteria bacterium]|nr:DUF2061 domain-containing protein [Gammaproteobacteria bacterium]MCP4474781.1 DUF2061 domain-containing protein [Gammaproteobacteria bacterium]
MRTIESHLHSLIKAVSWRVIATLTTIAISYAITHKISYALAIGSTEVMAKIVLYYFHERIWLMMQTRTVATKNTARH